jgi:hypothetical protein
MQEEERLATRVAILIPGIMGSALYITSSGMRECWFKASILYLEKAATAKRGAGGRKPARTRCN